MTSATGNRQLTVTSSLLTASRGYKCSGPASKERGAHESDSKRYGLSGPLVSATVLTNSPNWHLEKSLRFPLPQSVFHGLPECHQRANPRANSKETPDNPLVPDIP
jgi:hypothetical protein